MATLAQYFDPFFTSEALKIHTRAIKSSKIALEEAKTEDGGIVTTIEQQQANKLPIKGQGTIAVKTVATNLIQFSISTEGDLGSWTLHLVVGLEDILLYQESASDKAEIPFQYLKTPSGSFIVPESEVTYWFSIDSNNGLLRYGKYYANKSMILIEPKLRSKNEEGIDLGQSPTTLMA